MADDLAKEIDPGAIDRIGLGAIDLIVDDKISIAVGNNGIAITGLHRAKPIIIEMQMSEFIFPGSWLES